MVTSAVKVLQQQRQKPTPIRNDASYHDKIYGDSSIANIDIRFH
jgi:hypothetical protein